MKKILYLICWAAIATHDGYAQTTSIPNLDSILTHNQPRPKVLLVGTWHFDYPGLDVHTTGESARINIFSDQRQQELQVLLDYLALFKPTKIAVEGGRNSGYLIRRYERWKRGEKPLGASEIDQIAIRLMDRCKLDTLYGVDAYPLLLELHDERDTTLPDTYTDQLLARHYFGGDDSISARYAEYYRYIDSFKVSHTLLDNFLLINSDKVLDRGFGSYISGGQFASADFEGPDALSMFWFNRNLRIFKNIKDIDYDAHDRILVLFGSGHISVLRYLFECSPTFELISLDQLGTFK
ncbi:MAG: DUF5694 domain-containing protein [Bacteroidia bacterium]|nr:DUF5694 domain-containing protein [Bacteroidia bacterium]